MKRGTFVGRSSRNCCSSACIAKSLPCGSRGRRSSVLEKRERERDATRRDGDKERERREPGRSRCSPQQWGCWRERLQEEEEEKLVLWRYLTSGSRCSLLPKVCSISFKLMDLWLPKAAGNMLLRYYYYYHYYYCLAFLFFIPNQHCSPPSSIVKNDSWICIRWSDYTYSLNGGSRSSSFWIIFFFFFLNWCFFGWGLWCMEYLKCLVI